MQATDTEETKHDKKDFAPQSSQITISVLKEQCCQWHGRFLQSPFWAAFKCAHGWNSIRFFVNAVLKSGLSVSQELSVLVRQFGVSFLHFSIAYVPMAPQALDDAEKSIEFISDYVEFLSLLSCEIRKHLPHNTLCIRYDLPVDFETCNDRDFYVHSLRCLHEDRSAFKLVKTEVDIQPPDTVLLNLEGTADEILAAMKPKWRYNIRLAQKKGVAVTAHSGEDSDIDAALDVFYTLYETTAQRDGIAIHEKSYYRDLLLLAAKNKKNGAPNVTLYVAKHDNDNLAAIIVLFCQSEAVYLYGSSSNVKRNFMPAYLLQWTAINDAKKYGCPIYDFYGTPPTDDAKHPMHGLYLFKTGFGGRMVHRAGSFDWPYRYVMYALYTHAERIRAFFHKKALKLIRGR